MNLSSVFKFNIWNHTFQPRVLLQAISAKVSCQEEFLVRAGGKEPSIWVAGDEGVILRTPVVQDIPGMAFGAQQWVE